MDDGGGCSNSGGSSSSSSSNSNPHSALPLSIAASCEEKEESSSLRVVGMQGGLLCNDDDDENENDNDAPHHVTEESSSSEQTLQAQPQQQAQHHHQQAELLNTINEEESEQFETSSSIAATENDNNNDTKRTATTTARIRTSNTSSPTGSPPPDDDESSHSDENENDDDDENYHQQQQHQQQDDAGAASAVRGGGAVIQHQHQPKQQEKKKNKIITIIGNPNNIHHHTKNCCICGRFPYKCPDFFLPMAGGGCDPQDYGGDGDDNFAAFDFEAGIYEFLYRMNGGGPTEHGGGVDNGVDGYNMMDYYDAKNNCGGYQQRDAASNNRQCSLRITNETAQRTMERCTRHMKRLQVELAGAGLIHKEDQSYICGDNPTNARMIAPFDYDEIQIGCMLGTGGFSSVFEISTFLPKKSNKTATTATTAAAVPTTTETAAAAAAAVAVTAPPPLNAYQIAAREFLTMHAQRQVDDLTDINGSVRGGSILFGGGGGGDGSVTLMDAKEKRRRSTISTIASTKDISTSNSHRRRRSRNPASEHVPTTARYAVKHLRRGLIKEPDRFERAAIDLVLEAQLLVAMDHENIISLRGWARNGPMSYVNGKNTDYFLILDKLPETLDEVIYKWRKQLKKYKAKLTRPWITNKTKFVTKLDQLLLHRLHAAQDVAAALEYMHDRRIMNRDLKSSNIGFDIRGDLKLFDFGLSRLLPSDRPPDSSDGYFMSRVGTKYYMAPEIKDKCPYHLSADVYSFGVVLWEILVCATPREVLHRLQNNRQTESSQRQRQKKGGGTDMLEAMACAADNAGTVLLQQRHRDGRCQLPICNCWPDEIQTMVKEALSNDPTKRPSMADLRFRLEEETEKLGSERRFDIMHRRSTFRIDMTNFDNIDSDNGESANNNNNDNEDEDNNHNNPTANFEVQSESIGSRTSHDCSPQLSLRA